MNEQELVRKVICHLDRGLGEIRLDTHQRLVGVRRAALLSFHNEVARPAPVWDWMGAGKGLFQSGRRTLLHYAIAAVFLIVGAFGIAYWKNAANLGDQDADVEINLLTGDLPINAYFDSGFDAWLKHSS